jgi:hypothetical protein
MFRRILVLLAAPVALMACGNPASESLQATAAWQSDQASQTDSTTSPRVAAAPPSALPIPAATTTATPIVATSESEHCLDLVNDDAFTEAVSVCVRAAGLDPGNTAVKQALETARREAAAAALGGSSAIPIAREDVAAGVAVDGKLP